MDLLVLGGTAWLGGTVVRHALERGHSVTCLARGSRPVPTGAELVRADRDRDDALAPVAGRSWDAVVDLTSHPGHVRRAVRDIRPTHVVLVSTASVYAPSPTVDRDEHAPLVGAFDGDRMEEMADYAGAKVACERALVDAAASAGATATVVRAGLIGGPGDRSARSGYWPWRFAHPTGEDVIAPDDPGQPTAIIDVRDLASWIVRAAERHTDGVFNATGETTTLGEVLALSREVAGGMAQPRAVSAARLAELGVAPWAGPCSLPLWIPDANLRGFATLDTRCARAAGLRTRPLVDTLRDVLAWEEDGRTDPKGAGLSDEDERRVRAALDEAPG